jgi:hypothetical protein
MTKANLYSFVTSVLDDFVMDATLFSSLLDVAQSNRENSRPWVILRTSDSTQTANTSDSFTTGKTLPADFKRCYTRDSIVLTDSQGNVVRKLREIPLHAVNEYKSDGGKFYINYATRQFFICGTQSQNATINLYYIKNTTKISAADTNEWFFDSYDDAYSKMLGFDVAVMHKHGIDYDQINAIQGDKNAIQAELIFRGMSDWDTYLAQQAQEGLDYAGGASSGFSELGGRTSNLIG